MNRIRSPWIGGASLALLVTFAACQQVPQTKVAAADTGGPQAPMFEVDAKWPKPLPNHWTLGNVIGVAVDANDHVWIVHRPLSISQWDIGGALHPNTPDRTG